MKKPEMDILRVQQLLCDLGYENDLFQCIEISKGGGIEFTADIETGKIKIFNQGREWIFKAFSNDDRENPAISSAVPVDDIDSLMALVVFVDGRNFEGEDFSEIITPNELVFLVDEIRNALKIKGFEETYLTFFGDNNIFLFGQSFDSDEEMSVIVIVDTYSTTIEIHLEVGNFHSALAGEISGIVRSWQVENLIEDSLTEYYSFIKLRDELKETLRFDYEIFDEADHEGANNKNDSTELILNTIASLLAVGGELTIPLGAARAGEEGTKILKITSQLSSLKESISEKHYVGWNFLAKNLLKAPRRAVYEY